MEISDFIHFRKQLHQFPEVSGAENKTKQRVGDFIRSFHPDEVTEIGTHGLMVTFRGKSPGKTIMVRAELDALPIQEINDFDYRSETDGVSHKCGHDGHMAILARLAFLLAEKRPEKGTVFLLFQPAEENGAGAKELYHADNFPKDKIDAIIALHNIPGYPLHSVIVKEGVFTPAVTSIIAKFKGKTSHAAEPENGLNPAAAIAQYLQTALTFTQPEQEKKDFFLVTPIYLLLGEKSYGISAGEGEVHLTIRAFDNQLLETQSRQLERLVAEIAHQHHLQYGISRTQEFRANENDAGITRLIRQAADDLHLSVLERQEPMKWGEDFGLFTEQLKGAMFGLGSGLEQPALHNPDYDFPDELIETGSRLFYQIVTDFLR